MNYLKWLFGLAAVALAWNVDIAERLRAFAQLLGAERNSFLESAIINLGTPVVFTIVTLVAIVAYERFIWPRIPRSQFQAGWWIYALRGKPDQGVERPLVVGYFRIEHSPSALSIPEGRAFYAENGRLEKRGDWSSNSADLRSKTISVLYTMTSSLAREEAQPAKCDGVLEFAEKTRTPLIGKSVWSGQFQDLGDRRGTWGDFYAERLGRKHARNATEAERVLHPAIKRLGNEVS